MTADWKGVAVSDDADRLAVSETDEGTEHENEHPRGTLLLILVYIVIIIGLWGSVYITLLDRG